MTSNINQRWIPIKIKSDVSILPIDHLSHLLLYGSKSFNNISNDLILTETIVYIFKSKRFKTLEAFLAWCSSETHRMPVPLSRVFVTNMTNHVYVFVFVVSYMYFFLVLWVCDGAWRHPVGYLHPSTRSYLYICPFAFNFFF